LYTAVPLALLLLLVDGVVLLPQAVRPMVSAAAAAISATAVRFIIC
jgi:hypothetical protein